MSPEREAIGKLKSQIPSIVAENRKYAFLILFEKIAKKRKEDPFFATEENLPYPWESQGNEKELAKKKKKECGWKQESLTEYSSGKTEIYLDPLTQNKVYCFYI